MIKIRTLAALNAAFLFMANDANAAGTWTETRNDAMGGTGVASSRWSSAVLINPALLTKSQQGDTAALLIPAVGMQITDPDNLQNNIDDISNSAEDYLNYANIPLQQIIRNPGIYRQMQNDAADLSRQLQNVKGDQARAKAGGAIAVSIPNETLPFAFVVKAYGTAKVTSDITQHDLDYLNGIANGTVIPNRNDLNNLTSKGFGRAAIVSDYGVAVAHKFDLGGVPVSVGVTPKLQKTWLYNYSTSVYQYKKDDISDSRYRNSDTGFNIDAGLAADFGDSWTVGVTGQNLVSRDIDTKVVDGFKDTYQIRPLVTTGVAWHSDLVVLTTDVDLTETKNFKSEDNSQFAGVGAEISPLPWLAVRAGYRADMRSHESNVFTGGVGFAPFDLVHVDLMGLYGEDQTWGAGLQVGMTF
ncbi:conjugal transfer protein TraF [Buttiauxella agrestis]|uniref:conjugal transfer protein TraF n=1 Tax=Buttiauxella agrestis TaxID=82977 RepID=UPI00155F6D83|nr:conjugal transfer protein TraF [Buttiauxella agrestis]BCG11179.1 type IX secretion system membrane protein PorP/SprF [Buttiauxella agrestis]